MIITGKTLDQTDKTILEMITKGKTCKEIARTLYLKCDSINYRLRILRREYKCASTPQLIAHLVERDLI